MLFSLSSVEHRNIAKLAYIITNVTEQIYLDEVEMRFIKDQVHTLLGFFSPFLLC